MVRVTWGTAANQAWLLGHEPDVLAVADAPWLGEGKHGFVDAGGGLGAAPAS
ncbi:MAG TPA: hypothetical protein VH558_08695 [Pseudolabrys sp.]|jgi:hypothetical protein